MIMKSLTLVLILAFISGSVARGRKKCYRAECSNSLSSFLETNRDDLVTCGVNETQIPSYLTDPIARETVRILILKSGDLATTLECLAGVYGLTNNDGTLNADTLRTMTFEAATGLTDNAQANLVLGIEGCNLETFEDFFCFIECVVRTCSSGKVYGQNRCREHS